MKLKKVLSSLSIILALSAFSTISFPDDSEAKRFGGKRSIGRSVTPKASPPAGSNFTQQRQSPTKNQAVNNATGASAMSRTGMFGGMFGGLLAGTLLGSLLMGGGLGAGAGGFLDIIIIGLIAFFAFRFFKSRSAKSKASQNSQQNHNYQETDKNKANQDYENAWERFRDKPATQYSQDEEATVNANIPASFNEEEFLTGAKTLYLRMQEAWDTRDFDDIAQFTTPALFAEVQTILNEDTEPSKTEVILVEATLTSMEKVNNEEQVSVLFDVHIREDGEAEQVQEIWNFTKPTDHSGSWKLDGIQQL